MKSFDKMTKEEILNEANIARKATMILTTAIFKYLGDKISKDDLLEIVSDMVNPNIINELTHKYLLADYLGVCGDNLDLESSYEELDDVDELKLKED